MPLKKRGIFNISISGKCYNKSMRKKAFTLAETLIVIAIIGIIAIIVIFKVTGDIMSNARLKQTIASKHKFAKAIEQMALNYDIGAYYGTGNDKTDATAEFVDKFRNYYKLNRVCSALNLEDCWGYSTIKFINGNTYEIKDAINGKLFKNGGSESVGDDYDVDTAGILGTDGTRFILAYNKNCQGIEPQVYTWNSDGTNNAATRCITGIMDIDGSKTPNTVGKDISFINATGIGNNCIIEIGDACFGAVFDPISHKVTSSNECDTLKEKYGINNCFPNEEDYYLGAVIECGGKKYLPSTDEIDEMVQMIISSKVNYTDYGLPYAKDSNGFSINIFIFSNYEQRGLVYVDVAGYKDVGAFTSTGLMSWDRRIKHEAILGGSAVYGMCKFE